MTAFSSLNVSWAGLKSFTTSRLAAESGALKTKKSLLAPPVSRSMPLPPIRTSLPPPPLKLFAAMLPVSVLARPLPVPLMAAVPASTRFSMAGKAARLREMLDMMVSMPEASVMISVVSFART